MNNTGFEVTYTALQAPDTARDCAVVVSRATTAMVSSRKVRQAQAPVFFTRQAGGASFTVRSADRETIESLPASYGSVMGHFGEFERGDVQEIPAPESFSVVYAIGRPFSTYTEETRRRLTRQVGSRLREFLNKTQVRVCVRALESNCTIVVSGAKSSFLATLPLRFNAVFERSQVMQLH